MNIFNELLQTLTSGRHVTIVTLTGAPSEYKYCLGQQLLLYPEGTTTGCIVNDEMSKAIAATLSTENWTQARVIKLAAWPGFEFFWDKPAARRQALIYGAGHISQPLAEILALADYAVTVADDRPDFANIARFPKVDRVFCGSFNDAFKSLPITSSTAVVIVTRGHMHDLVCLRHAIKSSAFYIGMIGSRRKVRLMFDELQAEGVTEAEISRVFAPIGLNLHAHTPAEIAISIAAEILAVEKGSQSALACSLSRRGKGD